ncbi:MAG: 2Fe-2S iron-sulfur cluster-binding protein [Methyloligellaceae bacterium]
MNPGDIVSLAGALAITAALTRGAYGAVGLLNRHIQTRKKIRFGFEKIKTGKIPMSSPQQSAFVTMESEPDAMNLKVVAREYETLDRSICSFYLASTDGRPLPGFKPGQHVMIELPDSNPGSPIKRCYSLSEAPENSPYRYRITIKNQMFEASQADSKNCCSAYFHNHVGVGSTVRVQRPGGNFTLDSQSDRPIVLIAGGSGITPLLSMLNSLATRRSQREIWLFYGVRNKNSHLMYNDLGLLQSMLVNYRHVVYYSRPTQSCRRGVDYHVDGRVEIEPILRMLKRRDYLFYVCGPEAFNDTIRDNLVNSGVPDSDINMESFGARKSNVQQLSNRQEILTPSAGSRIKVRFARSKIDVNWSSHVNNILELAEVNGLSPNHGCRSGQCGACQIKLKSGTVDYTQNPSVAVAKGSCLPCVSRPKTDIILDL